MRIFSLTLVCRMGADDKPDVAVDLDLEDGVPVAFLGIVPGVVRGVADQIEQQMEDGTANIVER